MRNLWLYVGAVLFIGTSWYHLEALYFFLSLVLVEIYHFLNVFVVAAKVAIQQLLKLSLAEMLVLATPFVKRFFFLEIPKKIAAPILFIVAISSIDRHTLRDSFETVKLKVVAYKAAAIGHLAIVFGSRAAVAGAIIMSVAFLMSAILLFDEWLVYWFGSWRFLRPVWAFVTYVWSIVGTFVNNLVLRILAFLGLNRVSQWFFRFFPKDLRSRIRAKKFGLLRKAIRDKRARRELISNTRWGRLMRLRRARLAKRRMLKNQLKETKNWKDTVL